MHTTFQSNTRSVPLRTLACFAFALAVAPFGQAQSTIDPANKYAYGANTGWVNFRHDQPVSPAGVTVTEYTISGFAYAANFGWLNLGNGKPANGIRYSNAAGDHGINHDGFGRLGGYAYGANIGWVNFGWATPNDPNAPRINLSTGAFSGFAYSANVGWINLGTGRLTTASILCPDTDADEMADAWEIEQFGNTTTAGVGTDFDGDGQTDAAEYVAGTSPGKNADWLRIIFLEVNAETTKVSISFANSTPARRYRIETTTDLRSAWEDSGLGTFAPDTGDSTTRSIELKPASARCFRVVALRPLQ